MQESVPARSLPVKAFVQTNEFKLSLIAVSAVALVLMTAFGGGYPIRMVTLASIGVILALGLNLCYGVCGQINFGVAAYYALGAYGSTLLQSRLGAHFALSLPAVVIAGFVFAFAIAVPLMRLRHHTLALGTFATSMVVWTALQSFQPITGGGDGLSVPPLILFDQRMGSAFFLWLSVFAAAASYLCCRNLVSSRIGRAMNAVRVNEEAANVLGINVDFYKRLAFAVNGALAALAGALLAQSAGWIGTDYFDLSANVLILIMVCFGGVGSNAGAVVGGALIMLLPDFLTVFKGYRGFAYGAILVLSLAFMPGGVAGLVKGRFRPRQGVRSMGGEPEGASNAA